MRLEPTHGRVYRAIAADGEVLYVGMTTQLCARIKQHVKDSAWWPLAHRIENDPPLPLAQAFQSECDQIFALKPRFNKNGGMAQGRGRSKRTEAEIVAWRERYEAGATIEDIALDERLSTSTVRDLLVAAGTVMRRPGARNGVRQNPSPTGTSKVAHEAVVHVSFLGARRAHRRRGQKAAA